MHQATEEETEVPAEEGGKASPLTFGVSVEQRAEINRRAAEYGARVGRPVSVAEYCRLRALGDDAQDVTT